MNFSRFINYLRDICWNGPRYYSNEVFNCQSQFGTSSRQTFIPKSHRDGKSLPSRHSTNYQTLLQTSGTNYQTLLQTSGCPWPKATVKPPVWNPGPKIEIPHPENHVLKVFRFRSWKPRVWKSRPQSWDPKSWKPCPENHILKFPRPQSWDPKSWKPCPENHILKFPRPQSWDPKSWKPCPENHILKFPRSFCLAWSGLPLPPYPALPWPPRPALPCL